MAERALGLEDVADVRVADALVFRLIESSMSGPLPVWAVSNARAIPVPW